MFDGHNDTLLRLHWPHLWDEPERSFFECSQAGHLDLPRSVEGGLAGGFFAIFVPADPDEPAPDDELTLTSDGYTVRMPKPLDFAYARSTTEAILDDLFRIEAESGGKVQIARTTDELRHCFSQGVLAVVVHFEGAEALGPDIGALEYFYQLGLRSLGPVWSRKNLFAEGVPFRFPHSPDTGPGLTGLGRDLVRRCNELGIMLDLSHINERGFWDVAALSDAPLVATHSNAHALCPVSRNLTDRQLDAIGESDGVVGIVFDVSMLRADGHLDPDTGIDEIVRHTDYIAGRIGIDSVALGSDFDGAVIPEPIGDVRGLQEVVAAFRDRGYDDGALRKLTSENWIRVLEATWS